MKWVGWKEKVGEHAGAHTHTHTSVTAVASVPFSFSSTRAIDVLNVGRLSQ